jgi:hypothetical protein
MTRTPRRGRRGRRRRGDGSTGRSGSGCGEWCPARRSTRRGGSADIGTCPASGAGHACADRATRGPPVSALREQRSGSRESGAQPRWRDVVCSKLAVKAHHHHRPRRPVPSADVACRARRLYRLPRARATGRRVRGTGREARPTSPRAEPGGRSRTGQDSLARPSSSSYSSAADGFAAGSGKGKSRTKRPIAALSPSIVIAPERCASASGRPPQSTALSVSGSVSIVASA